MVYWPVINSASMERTEHQSNVGHLQARYHYLNLTFEQAERVLQFEAIKDEHSPKHMLFVWEEWDFELASFQEILTAEQMSRYQKFKENIKTQYVASLIEQDKESARWLDFQRAKIDYLKNSFIPDVLGKSSHVYPPLFSEDQSKIDYLKACYKTFLNDRRTEALVNHIRFNRTFAPNGWKLALLVHYTYCLLPDYWAFESAMDAPTKSVAQFIKERLYRQDPELETFQSQKMHELKEFDRLNWEKYARHTEGWSVWTRQPFSEEDEKTHWAMSLQLLSKDAFGFGNIE